MPNLGMLVLCTLTHEIEFLRLSKNFQLGHPKPPSSLFAGELAFAMVGGDTVRVSLGRLLVWLSELTQLLLLNQKAGQPSHWRLDRRSLTLAKRCSNLGWNLELLHHFHLLQYSVLTKVIVKLVSLPMAAIFG